MSRAKPTLNQPNDGKAANETGKKIRLARVPRVVQPPLRAVVFSPNNTMGKWDLGCQLYHGYLTAMKEAPPVPLFLSVYFEQGGARPFLREHLQTLALWKSEGRIDEVAIFTDASNQRGWVKYLIECLEQYAETPGLIGKFISREQCPVCVDPSGDTFAKKICALRDLSMISCNPKSVVLVDHRPDNTLNGYVVGIPEYTDGPRLSCLREECMRLLPTDTASKVLAACGWDEEKAKEEGSAAADSDAADGLRDALKVLSNFFATTNGDVATTTSTNEGEE